jgi:hypothetical protein
MSDDVKERVQRAYLIMTAAEPGAINVPKALGVVGFSPEETANTTI